MVGLAIFVGAGIGGLARYWISVWIQRAAATDFPWATLVVNVSGSFLLTLIYGLLEGSTATPEWRAFIGLGLLGGYTTFSTFSYETARLLQDGVWDRALLYITGSVVLSLAGAIAGFQLASALLRRG